jgi:gluconolactonase
MNKYILAFTLLISTTAFTQDSASLFNGSAEPQLVSKDFKFTEGPAVDKKGNVFFTDQPNDKIWKYDTDGKLCVFAEKTGRANGMYFDTKGNLVTASDERNELWSFSPKGKSKIILKDANGQRLNGPNDLWINKKGGIYFTDPYYARNYWDRKAPDPKLGGEKVYYLPKGKSQPLVVDDSIKKPNGIVGAPDGKTLYVSDIGSSKIYKYQVNKDGSLSNRQLFANVLTDGMTVDEKGNLYFAGNGVTVYTAEGKKIAQIKVPARWTANVCFGGKDKNILFITASEAVYILPMKVRGAK